MHNGIWCYTIENTFYKSFEQKQSLGKQPWLTGSSASEQEKPRRGHQEALPPQSYPGSGLWEGCTFEGMPNVGKQAEWVYLISPNAP